MESDARKRDFDPNNVISDNDTINNHMITEIERELQFNPYDMISMVFLLYDVAHTALQRLLVFQQVSRDMASTTNLNMLHEWFQSSKHTATWKHEFVEALLLCQLNSVVRKLGINVSSAQAYYQTNNIQSKKYINPTKKGLYKLCETMTADNLDKLKESLLTYDYDTTNCNSCELVFLKLICDKFITVSQFQYNKKPLGQHVHLDKLLRLIEALPGLKDIARDIYSLQESINHSHQQSAPIAFSTPSASMKVDESIQNECAPCLFPQDFTDVCDLLEELELEDTSNIKHLKSDRNKVDNDCYIIKNTNRVGVCVIINQVDFYPSKCSIESSYNSEPLMTRKGSDKDQAVLERTMTAFNFKIYTFKNLNHKKMFECLEEVLKKKVTQDDSVFMLCILSHGVKGHVYAADSVKVKMDDIQNFLDCDVAVNLHGKPKLLIVQACQVDEGPQKIVADNPGNRYTLKKINFFICWATAPELEAYRDETKGSIFIQILCQYLQRYAKNEHIGDIFTKVTDKVTLICEGLGCGDQVPISHSTFRRKLYLHIPERL